MHAGFLGTQRLKLSRCILYMALAWILNGCDREKQWRLHEISGHLPDLRFSLMSDTGQPVTEHSYQGYLVMLFFGFTHCQSECPATLYRMAKILQSMGVDANRARILFVTLDPSRDTPLLMRRYLAAFDAEHTVGMIGGEDQMEDLAKRYRIAYRRKEPDSGEIAHNAAVYVFDPQGHARLLITPGDAIATAANDLRRLLDSSP